MKKLIFFSARSGKKQSGVTTVEMAIVSALFFMLLIGVIDIARLLFTWNALDEVTRRGARMAAVCPVGNGNEIKNIQDGAVFYGNIVFGLNPEDVVIEYLDKTGGDVGDPVANFTNIAFVRSSISPNFQYQMLIPFFQQLLSPPPFSTIAIAESLGVAPPAPAGFPATGDVSC
ncbi:MAG: pilus assembly protein [Pseudomonadales bacterium]|nr:pilus assembly protein [Pseudomonadales bacterium]